MSAATNLKRRGAVYYCRRRIPKDLIAHYGTTELSVSLRTKDLREARRLASEQWLQWEADFDRIRAGRGVSELSAELIEALGTQWVAGVLAEDEGCRIDGSMRGIIDENTRHLQELEAAYRKSLAHGEFLLIERHADDVLHRAGIKLDKKSESYRRLCYRILKADIGLMNSLQARDRGDVVETPRAPAAILARPQAKRKGVTLTDALDKWAAERRPRSTTVTTWTAIIRAFTKINGALPVGGIEKQHVIAYKDSLVAAGRSPGTIKTRLAALHSLLEYCMQNDLAGSNAAAGVRVQAAKSRAREHIPIEDLQRLFTGEVFTKGASPRAGKGEAAFWLPLLALFSGARLEELGQMLVQDVKRTPDGIDYFEVTDRGEGQKLKTGGSRRSVPIHPELIRLGFLRYIEDRRAAGDARVFPLLRKDVHGRWTKNWATWWTRYRRSVGVDKRWHDMHALRHTFKRQCRECGIPKDIHDAITGHPSGDVADRYGGQYPLRPLAEAMRRLRYDGLDLSGVKAVAALA